MKRKSPILLGVGLGSEPDLLTDNRLQIGIVSLTRQKSPES